MKKLLKKLNIILIIAFFDLVFPINVYALQVENKFENNLITTEKSTKDISTKLYGIIGKSQLLKFDQNVSRISITDPSIADIVLLSPRELLLNGKKAGRTSLIFWGEKNNPIFYNLIVKQDTDAFLQDISQITGSEDVEIVFTDKGAILSGQISSTAVKDKIKEIAKAHSIEITDIAESPTKQVILEVKVAEASRNFTRQFSTQFSVGSGFSDMLNSAGSIGTAVVNNLTGDAIKYLYVNNKAKFAAQIKAAEDNNEMKILAEPKLLVMNGQKASFNAGQQVPIPSGIGQYGQVSYQFKDTGVILNFTPKILDDSNRVIIDLAPEISEIDDSASVTSTYGKIPGFKTRKVETKVELADGETLVIAGLLNNTSSKTKSQVPWLGDLPILGFFFSSFTNEKRNSELLIFITPKIVEFDPDSDRINL